MISIIESKILNKKKLSPIFRDNIKKGQIVNIVEKQNQRTTNYTKGKINNILTKSKRHTRGIKVRLETGEVGRVIEIIN